MAFQAFERKRMSQLGVLTRRKKRIEDLLAIQDGVDLIEINFQRAELQAIRKAHDDIINAMYEQPECQDEAAEKLQESNERFLDSYEEALVLLRQLEARSPQTSGQSQVNISQQSIPIVQETQPELTVEHLKAKLEFLIDDVMSSIEVLDQQQAPNYSLRQLQATLNAVNGTSNELKETAMKLMIRLDDQEKADFKEKHREIKSIIFDASTWINNAIEARAVTNVRPANLNMSAKVKLPPIDVPKFSGAPEDWISFRDLFATMIHDNTQLTGSQKFRYLKTCILDKLSPVKHMPESDAGYQGAWNSVLRFYDNKRRIVDHHFNALLNVKKMTAENCDELQKLLNDVTSNVEGLQRIVPAESLFEALAAHVIAQRLDSHTRDLWESENEDEIPMWTTVKKFLEKRRKTLCALSLSKVQVRPSEKPKVHLAQSQEDDMKCLLCGKSHRLMNCSNFLAMDVNKRYGFVKEKKLCFNCFSGKHGTRKCTSTGRCRDCGKTHHTLLHFPIQKEAAQSPLSAEIPSFVPYEMTRQTHDGPSTSHTAVSMEAVSKATPLQVSQTLLSTIAVYVYDDEGGKHLCRALLDSGSDANFMTSQFVHKLNTKLEETCIALTGINEKASIVRHKTKATISSHYGPFEKELEFSVISKITGNLPTQAVNVRSLTLPFGKTLADPKFHRPSQVDMLLNAEVFYNCLLEEKLRLPEGPMLIHTKFGWIIGGEVRSIGSSSSLLSCFSRSNSSFFSSKDIDQKLEKFFEAEDFPSQAPIWTDEEKYCENLFKTTTTKDEFGRPMVRMPMKFCEKPLGRNLQNATRQFHAQESKRLKDPVFNKLYCDYMEDFIKSGHMREAKTEECAYYLPHHGVVKMSSTSTKVRPVFNASSKSETGISLNDILCVGPTIQPESVDIITRFREGKYVVTGDISRMYRQIWIHPSQQKYLSVLWRNTPDEPLKHFQMKVVTFGTAPASFLATRVLQMVAEENSQEFPEASQILTSQFYVDDLMFSCDNVEDGRRRLQEICMMLEKAGLPLRKIATNQPEILRSLPKSSVEDNDSSCLKALGINYNAQTDEFSYDLKFHCDQLETRVNDAKMTKADVLSVIASIYDPIGWIAPVIVTAKIFMKKLWLNGLDWKTTIPDDLQKEWKLFMGNLTCLREVRILRRCIVEKPVFVELHGFCDASIKAYGAVIYVRSLSHDSKIQVSLLCSKSRVAPMNQKTLARLELCSATLLAKLISRYSTVLSAKISDVTLWSDSTIVLNWISMTPNKLQTFVGNRVAKIQEKAKNFKWRHVRGTENPADVLSRGLSPEEIQHCKIWWDGPDFLRQPKANWPQSIITLNEDDVEVKAEVKRTMLIQPANELFKFIESQKSSTKIRNIFGYILRFIYNSKREKLLRAKGFFSVEELKNAENCVIKIVQKTIYQDEYNLLQASREGIEPPQQLPKKSSLKTFSPFMDENGVLRVRGRLSANSELTFDQKHQIIIPHCNFSAALVRDYHKRYLHPTKTTLMAMIYQKYWIIKLKKTVKKIHYECVRCFRANPSTAVQLMGDLPEARVKLTTPFVNTAVDYTGFYLIRKSSARRSTLTKGYVVVFKCMCTGAIHLDIASDLSSQTFIAVLDRFVSRRGPCSQIFTDNATCFQGADKTLKKLLLDMEPSVKQYCANKMIKWNFTTPRSPSAGGIYESGIKLMKHHLKRIITRSYTYEQFYTILCKIEAVLNSRPITPMSNDPEDFRTLTPGHFLIGRPLTSLPQENHHSNQNLTAHWKGLQQIQQKFWQLWYQDYLHLLQTRPSGFREVKQFKIGQLVLVKEDNLPPMQWLLGRVVKLFPGKDKVVRNVQIKTQHGEKERNIRQLCPFPEEEPSA
jgi:hypothetical protein